MHQTLHYVLIASILHACSLPSEKEDKKPLAPSALEGNLENAYSIPVKYKLPSLQRMNKQESKQTSMNDC